MDPAEAIQSAWIIHSRNTLWWYLYCFCEFKPVFSLCLAGCNIPRQQKELFYFLCLFFSRLYHSVHWQQSVFVFYYSSWSCFHCGMFITHGFRPVFFLLGVKCQLYFDGRVDIPVYDWFLLVCCPEWIWWLSLLPGEHSMNELMAHEETEICVSGCQAGF